MGWKLARSVGGLGKQGILKDSACFPSWVVSKLTETVLQYFSVSCINESLCLCVAMCWTKDSHHGFCMMLRKCLWSETLQLAMLCMWSGFWVIDLELYVLCLMGINRAEAFLVKGRTSPTQPKVFIAGTQTLQRKEFSILIFIFYLLCYSSWLLIVLWYSLSI